ncbi:hypothetical protein [uncultured Microscilla sp.]|uniref:type III-A CRISPR-associated protein Cas10/Csm1 n=1 Tax=uncultured Microscilla sp. TaxID=432653 RepID=UPI00261C40A4|nr:hypothetical protein [uncultured Microscilla sp.]
MSPEHNYKKSLLQLFGNSRQPIKTPHYLLKGDVASVQSFIFSVQTKSAAKTLKAKSFYIQALTELCVHFILNKYLLPVSQVIYNGGAVFYILIPQSKVDDGWFENLQKDIAQALLQVPHDPNIHLGQVELTPNDDIGEKWEELNQALLLNELKPYLGMHQEIFKPFGFEADYNKAWKAFTEHFVKSKPVIDGFNIVQQVQQGKLFAKFGYELDHKSVTNSETLDIDVKNTVLNKLPLWNTQVLAEYADVVGKIKTKHTDDPEYHLPKNNNIIDFEAMSLFAERRTGTAKLAVLKMDIDNLGTYFRKQTQLENAQKLSSAFGWFFQTRIYDFLDVNIPGSEDRYRENIYIIFSGGDDCFLVGAWDAVFEFAPMVQQEFQKFQKGLRDLMKGLSDKCITLSAGLLMIDEHFPVSRFAELAEEAIDAAKTYQTTKETKPSKNKVCVFGEVISWKDLTTVKELTGILKNLVAEEKSRSILERVKRSATGYESLQKKIEKGHLSFDAVWRFSYYLRNVKTKKGKEIINDEVELGAGRETLVQAYQRLLISAISNQQYTNAAIFPVAARWTEFLTRKKQ